MHTQPGLRSCLEKSFYFLSASRVTHRKLPVIHPFSNKPGSFTHSQAVRVQATPRDLLLFSEELSRDP